MQHLTLGAWREGTHPPGKLLYIILARNLPRFSSPSWHVQLLWIPPDPLGIPLGRRLRHQGPLATSTCQRCVFSSQELFNVGVEREQALQILHLWSGFWSGPVRWVTHYLFIPQADRWSSLAQASILGLSSKVTNCFDHEGLGDWAHLLVGSVWCDTIWGLWSDKSQLGILADGCPSTRGFLSVGNCSWGNSLASLFNLQEVLQLSMLASRHLSPQLSPLCRSLILYHWISHRWHGSGHYSWPGVHA